MVDDLFFIILFMDNCCYRFFCCDFERCYLFCWYVLVGMFCLGFCVVYFLRVNLSVVLVVMVNLIYVDVKVIVNNFEC